MIIFDKKAWREKVELYRAQVAIAVFGAMLTGGVLGFLIGLGIPY